MHYGPGFGPAANRIEYHDSSWGGNHPIVYHEGDWIKNITVIECVQKEDREWCKKLWSENLK
jgi:hypothetical protein